MITHNNVDLAPSSALASAIKMVIIKRDDGWSWRVSMRGEQRRNEQVASRSLCWVQLMNCVKEMCNDNTTGAINV